MITKTYSELSELKTFEERFEYLKLDGIVGQSTFGYDRYLNQRFYQSEEWKHIRREVIIRDNGCDLGLEGFDIRGRILIHHINPITVGDLVSRNHKVLDLENLIVVSNDTHQAIHYGDRSLLSQTLVERSKNDTCPWKIGGDDGRKHSNFN